MALSTFAQSGTEYPAYANNDLKIENKIQIFPNPSIDFVKVQIESSTLVNPQIVIHSVIGNQVVASTEKISDSSFKVNVKNLPAGYYLLAVKDESTGFSETYKFLKR